LRAESVPQQLALPVHLLEIFSLFNFAVATNMVLIRATLVIETANI